MDIPGGLKCLRNFFGPRHSGHVDSRAVICEGAASSAAKSIRRFYTTKLFVVMPGLVPGIHALLALYRERKTWMAGTSPAMTSGG
jgi:hypothetical protein